jgi:large subunit ribosomal protein L15
MMKRLPRRRGFTNIFRVEFQAVNLSELRAFEAGVEVTPELLKERRIVRSLRQPVKILGMGEIDRALTVRANRFSGAAKQKIEAAGGTVIETDERRRRDPATDKRKRGKKKAKPEAKAEAEAKTEAEATETKPEESPEAATAEVSEDAEAEAE